MPDFDDILARMDSLRDDIQEAADEVTADDPRVAELEQQIEGLTIEAEQHLKEIDSLRETIQTLQGQVDAFNSLLAQAQSITAPSA